MAVKMNRTTIQATRGDTILLKLDLLDREGQPYVPTGGDEIRFAMKHDYNDAVPILVKIIPTDTMLLRLDPEDTKGLPQPSTYVYDIQLTTADGYVDTFIDRAKLILTEEVD